MSGIARRTAAYGLVVGICAGTLGWIVCAGTGAPAPVRIATMASKAARVPALPPAVETAPAAPAVAAAAERQAVRSAAARPSSRLAARPASDLPRPPAEVAADPQQLRDWLLALPLGSLGRLVGTRDLDRLVNRCLESYLIGSEGEETRHEMGRFLDDLNARIRQARG